MIYIFILQWRKLEQQKNIFICALGIITENTKESDTI